MTETYVAYGAMRELIKECSRAGHYRIPQALVKDGEIPVDENGTHVGEGDGWWYECMFALPPSLLVLTRCSAWLEANLFELVANHLLTHVHATGPLSHVTRNPCTGVDSTSHEPSLLRC